MGIGTMRKLLAALTATLIPVIAHAQGTKPIQLADYVSFCLALWADVPDIQAKATALGLQDGLAGARAVFGKTTIQFYKSVASNETVGSTTTIFADGKDLSCDVNIPGALDRADLERLEQTLHLDGQIITPGSAIIGRWKMPDRQPPVLLKAVGGRSVVTLVVQQFFPMPKGATQLH
jgi:hypothetical protein